MLRICLSQWPRSLRRVSAAARLLGLRVRIPSGTWMYVSCECCVLSSRGFSVGLITRPERSPTECDVSECDREASIIRTTWPTVGYSAMEEKWTVLTATEVNNAFLYVQRVKDEIHVALDYHRGTETKERRVLLPFLSLNKTETCFILLLLYYTAFYFYVMTQYTNGTEFKLSHIWDLWVKGIGGSHLRGQCQTLSSPVGRVMNSFSARVFPECFGLPIPPLHS
jgi:hypothetical protein